MVKQTRIIVETSDVLQIRLRCGLMCEGQACDGEVLVQLGRSKRPPAYQCPRCGEDWVSTFSPGTPSDARQRPIPEAATLALVDAIQTLAAPERARFTVCLEIDGEEPSP